MQDEVIKMPEAHHRVMQLEYAKRNCRSKKCWEHCLNYACDVNVVDE